MMLSFLKFYKFWGSFFLDLKSFKSKNIFLLKNFNIKIKVSLVDNELLGMPDFFFSFLLKRFQKNSVICNKYLFFVDASSSFFFDLEFFLIFFFNLNLFKVSSTPQFFFLATSDLFYSNFNIFSINFLFKLRYLLKIQHSSFFMYNNFFFLIAWFY